MTNETRLDIGYEKQYTSWEEREKAEQEEKAKKAAWERKDQLYGRYLGHKMLGGTEEGWQATFAASKDFTYQEFLAIKAEWEKEAV